LNLITHTSRYYLATFIGILIFQVAIAYILTVYGFHLQNTELIYALIASGIGSSVLIFLAWWFFLKRINKTLWEPFFKTLDLLKTFDLRSCKEIKFEDTSVWEFQQLNQHLNGLVGKLQQDYLGQKHFVENASHELQTPLAVIKTQVELVLQSDYLRKEEVNLLASALDAADRLTKINRSLITLSRIENLQFIEKTELLFSDIINHNMSIFMMEAESRGLEIHYTADNPCKQSINDTLAQIIVRNLIQNAIRHNYEGGQVWISLNEEILEIKNTGKSLKVPSEKIFERFYKHSDSEGSIGLGLPIVKEICDRYDYILSYSFESDLHCLKIEF